MRFATAADGLALARLRYEFRAALNPATEDEAAFIDRCTTWAEERLRAAGPWRAWVAEAGGEVLGCLWLQAIEKMPNPGEEREWHAYITGVYARPEARGGVGTALLEAALAWCRAHGADSAILWPTAASRTLYARYGFESPADMMEAEVTPGRHLGAAT